MKRLPILCLLATTLLLAPGCKHGWFGKKRAGKAPKETSEIALDVEMTFRQRFLEKRTAELVSQGQRIDVARQQALDEFRSRYSFTRAASQQ
ncbi:MAG: hypothetical protein JSR48_11485 [Verrucomicrobia bacterium]|nr:hypothetical protein [Verrucomicrobiota bacterium]